jgi:hypothetical protein
MYSPFSLDHPFMYPNCEHAQLQFLINKYFQILNMMHQSYVGIENSHFVTMFCVHRYSSIHPNIVANDN